MGQLFSVGVIVGVVCVLNLLCVTWELVLACFSHEISLWVEILILEEVKQLVLDVESWLYFQILVEEILKFLLSCKCILCVFVFQIAKQFLEPPSDQKSPNQSLDFDNLYQSLSGIASSHHPGSDLRTIETIQCPLSSQHSSEHFLYPLYLATCFPRPVQSDFSPVFVDTGFEEGIDFLYFGVSILAVVVKQFDQLLELEFTLVKLGFKCIEIEQTEDWEGLDREILQLGIGCGFEENRVLIECCDFGIVNKD